MTSEGNLFSTTGGNYSLESRLQSVKSRLFNVNRKVRELESNMIFLLVNPELTYSTQSSSTSSSDGEGSQSQVMRIQQVDFGQEQFMTDPVMLDDELSQSFGLRHSLMTAEEEILAAIHERDKEKEKNHEPLDHHYYSESSDNFGIRD